MYNVSGPEYVAVENKQLFLALAGGRPRGCDMGAPRVYFKEEENENSENNH